MTPSDLLARLAHVQAAPNGVLHEERTPLHHIRIVKERGQVLFYFVNQDGTLDGPMSRLDPYRPLTLLSPYTRALLLALVWQPAPERMAMLGLAGGRLSLVLHHLLPGLVIDNVDIDPAAQAIAERWFGVAFNARQQMHVDDARAFLQRARPHSYDVIVMDAFRDSTDALLHLASSEFYALCRGRLRRGGVFAANILHADARYWATIKTCVRAFGTVLCRPLEHGTVLLCTPDIHLPTAQVWRRAAALAVQADNPQLVEDAAALVPYRDLPDFDARVWRAAPLLRDMPNFR